MPKYDDIVDRACNILQLDSRTKQTHCHVFMAAVVTGMHHIASYIDLLSCLLSSLCVMGK